MKSQSVIPKPDPELARWCEILSQSAVALDEVPAGWFTVAQLADRLGKSVCNTNERVRRMVAEGRAEKKLYRIQLAEKTRPVPHYRLK